MKITRIPNIGILGITFGLWALGFFVISPIFQNIGYMTFRLWEVISPTLITIFLYLRSVRHEHVASKKIQLHVAWVAALAVIVYLGAETWRAYHAAHDAPRGLLWDLYQFGALIFGAAAFWFCYAIGLLFTRKPKQSEPGAAPNCGPATQLGNSGVTEGTTWIPAGSTNVPPRSLVIRESLRGRHR